MHLKYISKYPLRAFCLGNLTSNSKNRQFLLRLPSVFRRSVLVTKNLEQRILGACQIFKTKKNIGLFNLWISVLFWILLAISWERKELPKIHRFLNKQIAKDFSYKGNALYSYHCKAVKKIFVWCLTRYSCLSKISNFLEDFFLQRYCNLMDLSIQTNCCPPRTKTFRLYGPLFGTLTFILSPH